MAPTRSKKPPYINPTGRSGPADLPSVPPFVFNGVTTRAFPIQANLAQLNQFCDDYLNLDQKFVQFRASLPFVYLMVLNYGRMSSASVQAQNVGWVSQHEVTFTVALERRCWDGKRWVFRNWACVSPFIFVDDELSQTTGREVYGWPKIVGQVEKDVPLWAADPRSPTRVFSLQIPIFPKLFAGAREELRDLIQVDRDPVPRLSEFPLDPDNPWNPLSILPNAARSWLGLLGVSLDMLIRSSARGYRDGWNLQSLGGMSQAVRRNLGSLLPTLSMAGPLGNLQRIASSERLPTLVNTAGKDSAERRLTLETITLKQFRDSQKPDHACYQAIVTSPMGIDRVNRLGLLGDYNLLRGDISGGYTIRLHRYAVQPIVETLGLEIAATEEGDDAPIAVLKPTLPFWTDVDLHYGLGEVICSRSQCFHHRVSCSGWKHEGRSSAACPEPEAAAQFRGHCGSETDAPPRHILYNTAQGGATQPISGPFHFPDVTLQIYPLMADRSRLQGFLDEYLNQPLCPDGETPVGLKFEPFGSYVYLMVSVQGGQIGVMWSETNNIGWWADKEVSFCVPVKCYRRKTGSGADGSWQLISLGMVSPFVFGNSGRAVITDREVNGRPTVKATIESPADSWVTPSGPIAERQFLKLETEIFPALHLGQRAEQRTLLEIDGSDAMETAYSSDDVQWRTMLDHWGEKALQELRRKTLLHEESEKETDNVCALAAEVLCLDAPLNSLHLKQYRDASEPGKACYQALVKTCRHVTRLYELREIEQQIHVRLHKYPGFPISETLGLKVKHVDSKGGDVVQILEPARPFWMRVGLREHLGEVLCWRTEQRQWTPAHPWVPGAPEEESAPAAPPFFVGPGRTGAVRDMPADTSEPYCAEVSRRLHRMLADDLAAIRRTLASDRSLREAMAEEIGRWKPADAKLFPIRDAIRKLITPSDTEGAHESVQALPLGELYALTERLFEMLSKLGKQPDTSRPTREQARLQIEKLPELQVVLEAFLSRHAVHADDEKIVRKDRVPHHLPLHSLPWEWLESRVKQQDPHTAHVVKTEQGYCCRHPKVC